MSALNSSVTSVPPQLRWRTEQAGKTVTSSPLAASNIQPAPYSILMPKKWQAGDVLEQHWVSPTGNPITGYTLPNGYRLIVEQRPTNIIGMRTFIKGGSIVENAILPSPLYHNSGFLPGTAHVDEHCHFLETRNFPVKNSLSSLMEELGTRFNASTSSETIQHEIFFNREDASTILPLHQESILRPEYTSDIQQEKVNVLNEATLRNRMPEAKVYSKLRELMFDRPEVQTLGRPEDIEAIEPDQLMRFWNQVYTPTNMVTVVSGNIQPQEVLQMVAPGFGNNPPRIALGMASATNTGIQLALKPQEVRRAIITDPHLSNSFICIGFPAPPKGDYKTRMAMEFLNEYLVDGPLSALKADVEDRQQLANTILGHYEPFQKVGSFEIMAYCQPGREQATLTAIRNNLADLDQHGISDQTMANIRERIIQQFKDNQGTVQGATYQIGEEAVSGSLPYYLNYLDIAQKITPADLQNVANAYLNPNRYAVVFGVPEKGPTQSSADPATGGELNSSIITAPISSVNALRFGSDSVRNSTLINGAHGYFLRSANQPKSKVSVILPSDALPPGSETLLDPLLTEGSDSTKQKITQWLGQGIRVDSFPMDHQFCLTVEGPVEQEAQLPEALFQLLMKPVVDPATFQSIQRQQVQEAQNNLDNPQIALRSIMEKQVYGPNHPFSLNPQEKSNLLSRQTLPTFGMAYQRMLQAIPKASVVMISSEPIEVQQQWINSAIRKMGWYGQSNEDLSREMSPMDSSPLPNPQGRGRPILVSNNTLSKALVQVLWDAPDRARDPDYPAFCLLRTLLRGQSDRSFFQTLRTQDGLVYTVSQFPDHELAHGRGYQLNIEVDFNQIDRALQDIGNVTQSLCQTPITTPLLDMLKRKTLLDLRSKAQSASGVQELAMPWLQDGLEPPPLVEWQQRIQQITPLDIQRVANRMFNPNSSFQLVGLSAPDPILSVYSSG